MKRRKWSVNINGQEHVIEFTGWRKFQYHLLIDGNRHTVGSLNTLYKPVDYRINFGDVACHFVVDGFKIDLAVDGKYAGSGEAYAPLSPIPVSVTAMAALSVMDGILNRGGILSGILLGLLYYTLYSEKKNVRSVFIAFCIAETALSTVWFLAELWLLN